MCIDNYDLRMMCYLMSHENTVMFDDGWTNDDNGVWWLNIYVMVDEWMIIIRCHIMRVLKHMSYVWFLHVMLYMWW